MLPALPGRHDGPEDLPGPRPQIAAPYGHPTVPIAEPLTFFLPFLEKISSWGWSASLASDQHAEIAWDNLGNYAIMSLYLKINIFLMK